MSNLHLSHTNKVQIKSSMMIHTIVPFFFFLSRATFNKSTKVCIIIRILHLSKEKKYIVLRRFYIPKYYFQENDNNLLFVVQIVENIDIQLR